MEILDGRQATLDTREVAVLKGLKEALVRSGAPFGDVELVGQALVDMKEVFLIVVAGEFDSGKSAFVGALVGHDVPGEAIT